MVHGNHICPTHGMGGGGKDLPCTCGKSHRELKTAYKKENEKLREEVKVCYRQISFLESCCLSGEIPKYLKEGK